MTSALDSYFETSLRLLKEIHTTQRPALEQAADWVCQALDAGRFIYAFGSGHSHTLAEEVFYRAGGLARTVPILDPKLMVHESAVASTDWERREGYAETVLARYPMTAGDVLFVVSNSGRNAVPIEMALGGRQRGAKVVAIVSARHCASAAPRHSSGRKLTEVVDLVIDNGGKPGDACVTIPGLPQKVAPTSTVTSAAILNAVLAEAAARASAAGNTPEVWISANTGAGDANAALLAKYRGRIPHL
ncbi:MAG TPA: SIS domain-containing protein [Verrucomicrobiota bacterium]|nr:SIS domain-containing protein [Verrucomicrobiota bacterium]HQB17321.1 SIS domain-containing protein [Verrucomicrobiota bacterium]